MKTVFNTNRFYRDPVDAKVSGVCSGLAKHFNINAWIIRGLAIIAFLMFPMATGLAYVLAIILLKYRYTR